MNMKKLVATAALALMVVGTQAGAETLRVGSETVYPPFEFLDSNSGKYVGFDIDLIDEVAKRAGFEPQILSMGLDGLIPALMSGSIDVAVPPSRLRRSVPPRSTSRSRTMNLGFPLWPARTMLPSRA